MESVYHFVTIHVNETSWAHIWRLCSRYLGMGYDKKSLVVASILHRPAEFHYPVISHHHGEVTLDDPSLSEPLRQGFSPRAGRETKLWRGHADRTLGFLEILI
jgi:hypothetical protein